MTLIGTPPTLIMHDTLLGAGFEGLQFFTTLPVGLILLVFGVLLLWPLTKILDKKDKRDQVDGKTTVKSPEQLASDYRLIDNLYRIIVQKESPIIGENLSNIDTNAIL